MFDVLSGTGNLAFRQNTILGGQPVAQFYSSTKLCTFHGGCQIPNMYGKTFVDILIADIFNDTYIKTENVTLISKYRFKQLFFVKTKIDTLFLNSDLGNHYTKSEVDDIGHELSIIFEYLY